MTKNCLPNFFIVGAAKAGTTSLANYLAQHPDIFIPELKEPKYFSCADNKFPHNGPGDAFVDSKVIMNLEKLAMTIAPMKIIKLSSLALISQFEKMTKGITKR